MELELVVRQLTMFVVEELVLELEPRCMEPRFEQLVVILASMC